MPRFHVNLVVEVEISAPDPQSAAREAERRIQDTLDARQKTLSAVVGADYGDVSETPATAPTS